MKELLRVTMNEKQVREACEDWARSRSRADGAAASVIFLPADAANPEVAAEVIFTRKRERKAKNGASPSADPTATF